MMSGAVAIARTTSDGRFGADTFTPVERVCASGFSGTITGGGAYSRLRGGDLYAALSAFSGTGLKTVFVTSIASAPKPPL